MGSQRQVRIKAMQRAVFTLTICLLAVLPAFAVNDSAAEIPAVTCGNGVPGGINCVPSKEI